MDARTGGRVSAAVYESLYEYLASARDGTHVDRMARHVLGHAAESVALLGLDRDGRRAIFYDRVDAAVYAVPFTPRGLHVASAVVRDTDVSNPRAWIRRHRGKVCWISPRFRPPVPTEDRMIDPTCPD